jgi:hypothetical protein
MPTRNAFAVADLKDDGPLYLVVGSPSQDLVNLFPLPKLVPSDR